MSARRVAITGIGMISPYGGSVSDFFDHLVRGVSGVSFMETDDVPQPLATPFVLCRGFESEKALGKPLSMMMERFSQMALASAFSAWEDAGFDRKVDAVGLDERQDWGCMWGTALGGISAFERGCKNLWLHGRERLSPLSVVLGMHNAANSHISIQLALGGVSVSHNVACASSSIAIGEAFRRVRSGESAVMLAGGSDVSQCYGIVKAWEAMRIMALGDQVTSPSACRPFAADRRGLVLGEGAAALVLEDWDHAVRRGAHIHAELVGYGNSSDRDHLVRPNSSGQVRAVHAALKDGAIALDEVGYVNAHGTATAEGDPIEINALKEVFGDLAPHLPVSATKSMHGHLLGAAGAIEAVVTILALREQAIPPTANLAAGGIDPTCEGVDHVLSGRKNVPLKVALSNSFAFGGSNAVLAFRAAPVLINTKSPCRNH